MKKVLLPFLLLMLILAVVPDAKAQIPRERSGSAAVVEELFWAPSIILQPSSTQIDKGNLDFTIQHAFGLVSRGVKNLYGLDDPANIRFGLDYGVRDWLSAGIGRSRFDKTFDGRIKLRLTSDPALRTNVFVNAAVETPEDGRSFEHRMSYFSGLLLSRKISEKLFVQVMPAWSHFNLVDINKLPDASIEAGENDHFILGVAARYELSEQVSALLDYMPVLGNRSDNTNNVVSIGMDFEAGGHVFQMFFTSTQWITPQHAISESQRSISDGDLGFGFNIHRMFGSSTR